MNQIWKAHAKPVYRVLFSPNGSQLVTSAGDKTVKMWALPTSKDAEPTQLHKWPGSDFWSPIAISSDGKYVARGGYGVAVWRVADGTLVHSSKTFTEALAFSPDAKTLAVHRDSDKGLARWSIPGFKPLAGGWGGTRSSTKGDSFPNGGLAYHPKGTLLAGVFGVLDAPEKRYDSSIYLWDAKTGEDRGSLLATLSSGHPPLIVFSPNGKLLAAPYGPSFRIWDVTKKKELVFRKPGTKHIKSLAFTEDNRQLLTADSDSCVQYWSAPEWEPTRTHECGVGKVLSIAISPDRRHAAAGGSNGKVSLWEI